MEIVELNDYRYLALYSRHHLLGCKNYFFLLVTADYRREFLIWPGGKIKIRHALSNKRLGRIKTKPVMLTKDAIRCVVGQFGGYKDNWMSLKEEVDDYCTLSYDPTIDVRVLDEIMWILERLK